LYASFQNGAPAGTSLISSFESWWNFRRKRDISLSGWKL